MNEAGNLPTGSATYKRGLSFLLNTQAADGSWHVKSRIYHPYPVSPPYFETGFPYGHDQFISAAATSWAIMAISRSLPKRSLPPYTNAGANPKTRSRSGFDALMVASGYGGATATVELLLSKGVPAEPIGVEPIFRSSAASQAASSGTIANH
jgi:hypothetical protein